MMGDVRCCGFMFAAVRAYAIRPYTCSIEILGMLGDGLVPFSLFSGRMRYAPTVFLRKTICVAYNENRHPRWGRGWRLTVGASAMRRTYSAGVLSGVGVSGSVGSSSSLLPELR